MTLQPTALRLPATDVPLRGTTHVQLRGVLVTSDPALARAFRRELKRGGRIVPLDIYASLNDATARAESRYSWITIDLNGAVPPTDAVRAARGVWPGAFVALLSYRWSDREDIASAQADHVLNKPVRAHELEAFLTQVYHDAPPGLRNVS